MIVVEYLWGFLASLYCFIGLGYTSAIAVGYALLGGRSRRFYTTLCYAYSWCQVRLFAAMKITVQGKENLDPNHTYIVLFNHTSQLDPPLGYVVTTELGLHSRMLGKAELFKIPLLSQALHAASFVPVNRRDVAQAKASYVRVKANMTSKDGQPGLSYWVAAEGSRSPDGRLQPFKKGGFITAIETSAAILPIALIGVHKALPKLGIASFFVRAFQPVTAVIGPPIPTHIYSLAQKEELMEKVYAWFAATLPPDQQPEPYLPIRKSSEVVAAS